MNQSVDAATLSDLRLQALQASTTLKIHEDLRAFLQVGVHSRDGIWLSDLVVDTAMVRVSVDISWNRANHEAAANSFEKRIEARLTDLLPSIAAELFAEDQRAVARVIDTLRRGTDYVEPPRAVEPLRDAEPSYPVAQPYPDVMA